MRITSVAAACAAVVLAAVFAPGCSLMNSHVTWQAPKTSEIRQDVSLPYAIAYADMAKAAYRKKLGENAALTKWMGIGLIPLAAAAAGVGVTGASTDAFTALSLTGAAGLGLATWLDSKPEQRALVVGYNATSCAVDAVLPLTYVRTSGKSPNMDVNGLDTKIGAVERRIATLEDLIKGKTNTLKVKAGKKVGEAKKLVASARKVSSKARKLDLEALISGRKLKEAVDRIAGEVSGIIVENAQDIAALGRIIDGLSQAYGKIAKISETIAPKKADDKKVTPEFANKITENLEDLETEITALSTAANAIAAVVNVVADAKPIAALKACGVDEKSLVKGISIDPAGPIEITEKQPTAKPFSVTGGRSPYGARVVSQIQNAPTVEPVELFGPAFVIHASKETPKGVYTVFVSDGSGHQAFLEVKVNPADGQKGQKKEKDDKKKSGALGKLLAKAIVKDSTFDVGSGASAGSLRVVKSETKEPHDKVIVTLDVISGKAPKQSVKKEVVQKALLTLALARADEKLAKLALADEKLAKHEKKISATKNIEIKDWENLKMKFKP